MHWELTLWDRIFSDAQNMTGLSLDKRRMHVTMEVYFTYVVKIPPRQTSTADKYRKTGVTFATPVSPEF